MGPLQKRTPLPTQRVRVGLLNTQEPMRSNDATGDETSARQRDAESSEPTTQKGQEEDATVNERRLVADGGVTWYDLTAFKRDCLRILAEMEDDGAKMHGLGLRDRLEQRYPGQINHGRLYPNLDDLVAMDLVEKSELDRRTNSYHITEHARAMLRRQREAFVDLPVQKQAVADGGEK